jgi:ribose transport system ATP-binding protein
MKGIRKAFAGTAALDDVSFELVPGEVHVLAGENGAGKSTLMKILAGVFSADAGEIHLGGNTVSVIHQEISLIEPMSVADNIFLGRELGGVWVDRERQRERAEKLCAQLGIPVDVTESVENYPLSIKQLEIAKALAFDARILVMDEPTSALGARETERLFELIAELKGRGCGIIYISHRMEDIYRLADRITVLRDGRLVGTAAAKDLPESELIRWMIGRELESQFPERKPSLGPVRLEVQGFSVAGARGPKVKEVSFSVRAGEIVGLAGLQGCGASELFGGLFGAYGPAASGKAFVDGESFAVRSPKHSMKQGLAYLTAERKTTGLVLGMGIRENITLASLPSVSPYGWLRPRAETEATQRQSRAFSIRAASAELPVGRLSGGNQQKVALAKWAETEPKVLLLDEPTRGVDVGAKHEIYELMNRWSAEGLAILMATTDMAELLGMSDRILVLHRGTVTAEFSRSEATPDNILSAAMGGTSE